MTGQIIGIILSFLVGLGLGGVYFGGLWLTLKHLPKIKRPFIFVITSFFARTAAVLFGFYLIVTNGGIYRLLAAVLGFIIMRVVMVKMKGVNARPEVKSAGGDNE